MRSVFFAALAVGALMAPAAMAEVTNGEARLIVKDLITRQPGLGDHVGDAERQGSYIVVHTLSNGVLFRTLKVDPETGHVLGVPSDTMTGKRDAGTNS